MIFKTAVQHSMVNADTITGEFCEILNLNSIFGGLLKCDGGQVPAFQANVPNQDTGFMDDVAIGVGGLTELRDGSLWVEDYQGVYQEFGIGEVARSGGRVTGAVGSRQVSWKDESGDPLPQLPRIVRLPEETNLYHSSFDINALYANSSGVTIDYGTLLGMQCSVIGYDLSVSDAAPAMINIQQDTVADGVHRTEVYSIRGEPGSKILQFALTSTVSSTVNVDPSTGSYQIISGLYLDAIDVSPQGDAFIVKLTRTTTESFKSRLYIVDSLSSTRGQAIAVAGSGSISVGQMNCVIGADYYGPVKADGASSTRPACAMNFDTANHDDAVGTYYLEVDLTGDANVLDGFLSIVNNEAILHDGSVGYFHPIPDGLNKIGFVYSGSTWRLNVNGDWADEAPYDGTMLSGALDLFRAANIPGWAGLIERYAVADESIIDGKMA